MSLSFNMFTCFISYGIFARRSARETSRTKGENDSHPSRPVVAGKSKRVTLGGVVMRASLPAILLLTMPSCPICAKSVRPRADNPGFPFCSPRCKQVDLGKWLDEGYRISSDPSGAEDEDESLASVAHPNQEKACPIRRLGLSPSPPPWSACARRPRPTPKIWRRLRPWPPAPRPVRKATPPTLT